MTRLNRRHALGLLGATALTGCAPAIPVAQLGDDPFEGGIGGTGIVGVMVGAGSILINGLRVEVPDSARFFASGTRVSDGIAQAGIAMTIMARTHLGRLEAVRVDVDDPLVGRLERLGGALRINGSRVHLDPGAHGGGLIGQHVAASGLWQPGGSLRASLIRPAITTHDSVAGVLEHSDARGWHIGATRLQPPQGRSLRAGDFAVVSGAFSGGVLIAEDILNGRFRQGASTLRQLSVEGFLEPVSTQPGFRVAGLGHSFDRQLDLRGFAGQRNVFFGRYTGLFDARRAVSLPAGVEQRRRLLSPTDGANFAAAVGAAATQSVPRR